jgi:predicted nucleic acid-binding protein
MPDANGVFVDTNILIYADDQADAFKQERAQTWLARLWGERTGRVSTQVLNAYYVNVTKKNNFGLKTGDARAKVRRFQLWQPWLIDHATVETAWGIEARFGFSYADSLIVASAAHSGCKYLLSDDMQHLQQIDSVKIINPFLLPADEVLA